MTITPDTLRIGGLYNWKNQPERLIYMGRRHYQGDRRAWHQFAKVEAPGVCWSEVLDSDLSSFETTIPMPIVKGETGMICEYCTDPNGEACFPLYGIGPHAHPPEGGTVMLPDSAWVGYTPDPASPGEGVYWCPYCDSGKPSAIPQATVSGSKA